MNKQEYIDKMTNEALDSLEGANRATPKPFLFTRLTARMQKEKDTAWDYAGKFITRPIVAIAGLCLVIGINAWVITNNNGTPAATATETTISQEDDATSVASLYDIENPQ